MKTTVAITFLLLAFFSSLISSEAADTLRTAALSGTPASGTASGIHFSSFEAPALNDSHRTAFFGFLAGTGVNSNNDRGIWSESGTTGLTLIAREGNQAPDTANGVNFSDFVNAPIFNSAGQMTFRGFLTGTGVSSNNNEGIWSEGGGTGLALLTRKGNQAPGTPLGVTFSQFDTPILNSAGQTFFRGILTGSGVSASNNVGIWSEEVGGELTLIAREGNQVPSLASGVVFSTVGGSLSVNGAGQVSFIGLLTGTGINTGNNSALWLSEGGSSLSLIAREGTHAPGTANGIVFDLLSHAALNSTGQAAFFAYIRGTGVSSNTNEGIWLEDSNTGLALVAREGNQAPDTANGVFFSDFTGNPPLNDIGQTAFRGVLAGTGVSASNNIGIWSGSPADLSLVVRDGDQAPGMASGVNFINPSIPVLNDAGQTAFIARLTGNNEVSIWAEDRLGLLTLIAREGDLLDVDDGPGADFREIIDLSFVSSFNSLGELAFQASFTDGSSGVFVSRLVAIPEPTSFALAAIGLIGLGLKSPPVF